MCRSCGLIWIRWKSSLRYYVDGVSVLYVDVEIKETIYFVNVYSKGEKEDLTEDEKKAFKTVIKLLKEE